MVVSGKLGLLLFFDVVVKSAGGLSVIYYSQDVFIPSDVIF